MDSSRRAVESYWRSRMVDAATSDEDKVTPVYKLEEICELLRSSHVSIVKEVSEFVLKRLDHKSPIVKQKALRLIKYAVGKSGTEFRREMQRHSVAVRQLFHYKGQPDPLKGDALNKAVRDTAHEAISAIFSEQDTKVAAPEDLTRRIEGFGNTNYEMSSSEDRKSFLSEVVGLGSATIKQGLSNFTQGHSLGKNENGSYKSPNLRRSLTLENSSAGGYNPAEIRSGSHSNSGFAQNVSSGPKNLDMRVSKMEPDYGDSTSSRAGNKTREERLLETIVTSGGVRLQPTRDAIHVFLAEAAKLDALALSRAIESKLESPQWQVRTKAVCVLEAIARKRDEEPFSIITSYFGDNKDVLIRCAESPQASLREKANKVLSLFAGGQEGSLVSDSSRLLKAERAPVVQMPDLIDTSDPDAIQGTDDTTTKQGEGIIGNLTTQGTPLIDDLFGDAMGSGVSTSEQKNDEDPFADVSFHASEGKESVDDIFTGMSVDDKHRANGNHVEANKNEAALFDFFGSQSELGQENSKPDINDLMADLSINNNASTNKQNEDASAALSEAMYSDLKSNSVHQVPTDVLNQLIGSQMPGINANVVPPFTMPYNLPPGMMFNSALPAQQINYAAMGNFLAQQQFLAAMSNLQQYGMNSPNAGMSQTGGTTGGFASPFPDVFQAGFPTQAPSPTVNISKKPETKAFDFISDHLAAARDSKRTD